MITLQIITIVLLVGLLTLNLLPQKRAKIQAKIEKALRKPAKVIAPRSDGETAKDEIAEERKEENLPEHLRDV